MEIFSRKFANLNMNRGLFLLLFAIFSLVIGLISDFPIALYGLFSGLIFFIISLVYFSKYLTWNLGAKGEEIVIEELKKLGEDYRILNDVRLPNLDGNIDHVVIGENGIFVVETKHHKGYIKYENGAWTQEKLGFKGKSYLGDFGDPIKQVGRNAVRLREFISEQKIFSENFIPWINTIIVFTNPKVKLQTEKVPTDIIRIGDLCKAIRTKETKIKLRKDEIDKVFDILKSKTTTSKRGISSFEDISESYWLKNYLRYIIFGSIWGVFYSIGITALTILILKQQLNLIDHWIFGILFNGIILFVLGKSIIDFFKVKINNDFSRLSTIHLIPYFLFLFFMSGLFGSEGLINNIAGNIFEIGVRFVIIVLTVLIYNLFNWRLPS